MHELPDQSVDAKRTAFEEEFDHLIDRIATYAFTDGKRQRNLANMILAFSKGDPVAQVRGIAGDVTILERGLRDPDLIPNAINGLSLLGNGPSFEGFLLMASTVSRNQDQLREAIKLPDLSTRQGAIELFATAHGAPGHKDVWRIVEENAEIVAQDLVSEDPTPAMSTLVQILRAEGSETTTNVSDKIFKFLETKLEAGEITQDQLIGILAELARYDYIAGVNRSYSNQVNGFLQKHGIDPVARFLEHWHREGNVQEEIALNLKTIAEIEKQRPGIVKILHDEFGIRHFSRYSASALIAQYDSRDDISTPYGIVISAQRDWNGSFRENGQSKDFNKLNVDLNGNYLIRFTEVEDGVDLVRRMRSLNQRYSQENKISFVFLNSHSTEEFVQLDEGKHVRTEDFSRGRGDILRSYLTPEAVVALIGCNSGKKGDFANQLAEKFGLKVIASKGFASKISIKVIQENPVDFNLVFHRGPRELQKKGEPYGGVVVYDYRRTQAPAL